MRLPELSVIVSIFNRAELFRRGLWSWSRQTLDRERFEVVVIDDASTDDLHALLRQYRGKLRIQYVRYDHTLHPIYRQLNAGWSDPVPRWYHTPALAHNLGFRVARARTLYVTQPEIIQYETNAAVALEVARADRQVYGDVHMAGVDATNTWRDGWAQWGARPVASLLEVPHARESTWPGSRGAWYIGIYVRETVERIGGVDEEYQRGCYGEDDNFRERCKLAGAEVYAEPRICGIHQWHFNEREPHRDRDGEMWVEGAIQNKRRYAAWQEKPVMEANPCLTWGSLHHVTYHEVIE